MTVLSSVEADSARARVEAALDEVRPLLARDGGDVWLMRVDAGIAYVQMVGACGGCSMVATTLKGAIERTVVERCPRCHRGHRPLAMTAASTRLLQRVRKLALALPEANERASHGMPTFWVSDKKTFAMFADHHHGDAHVGLWFAGPPEAQMALTESDTKRFFLPPYVAYRGWTGLRLDVDVDWELTHAILVDAYCAVAPARLVARVDGLGAQR